MRTLTVVSIAVLAAAGCDIVEPGAWPRGLGHVVEGDPPFTSLIAPNAVTRGAPFQITASTFGSSSCNQADGYELDALPSEAEVRLFDRTAPPGTICTEDFGSFPRVITLQFDELGTAEIRVIGRGDGNEIRIVRKTIVVQ
jgi:hypothetical protein